MINFITVFILLFFYFSNDLLNKYFIFKEITKKYKNKYLLIIINYIIFSILNKNDSNFY